MGLDSREAPGTETGQPCGRLQGGGWGLSRGLLRLSPGRLVVFSGLHLPFQGAFEAPGARAVPGSEFLSPFWVSGSPKNDMQATLGSSPFPARWGPEKWGEAAPFTVPVPVWREGRPTCLRAWPPCLPLPPACAEVRVGDSAVGHVLPECRRPPGTP